MYIGIYAATLSSALASLVGAPRVLQAVARDDLFSWLAPFKVGVGVNDEPIPAYIITIIVAIACILIGDLNAVAPLISGFFLASYALVNYATYSMEVSKSPGWRPSFRYYSKWTALLGALACVGMMFFLDWIFALISWVCIGALYYWVAKTTGPSINWGSAAEGATYLDALRLVSALQKKPVHTKNFRPQLMVLVGERDDWAHRAGLVHFARHCASKSKGLNVFASVQIADFGAYMSQHASPESWSDRNRPRKLLNSWLARLRAPGFVNNLVSPTMRMGVQSLMQLGGLGQLRPNCLVMGFKHGWAVDDDTDVGEYVAVIGDAFDCDMGVCLVAGKDAYERLSLVEGFKGNGELSEGHRRRLA